MCASNRILAAITLVLLAACPDGSGSGGGGGVADRTPPSVPQGLTATPLTSASIAIAWSPSSDDVNVAGYRVYRDGSAHHDEPSTAYTDNGLAPSTSYCYRVLALDLAGNQSPLSAEACATTFGGGVNYTLTVSKGGAGSGTVTGAGISCGADCSETVASGTSITLTASAAGGSTFASWSGCDAPSGATCTMTMTGSKTVTASFNVAAICTPGATRCVSGDIEVQERCNAGGTAWVEEGCGAWRLCAKTTCRVACGMSTAPASPAICLVPIADGVNNGEWSYWTDSRLAVSTYVHARSQTNAGGYAPIYGAAAEAWPYTWSIGSMDIVGFEFKLNQFGAYKHPILGFRARRAGIVTGYVNNFLIGVFSPTATLGSCSLLATFGWTADSCNVGGLSTSLNYVGGWNSMLLSITGDGYGGAIDLMDVNYVYLTIAP
jgi:hypothetical protein